MLQLPHDCKASELAVSPKNWNSKGASVNADWRIHYRFYEPGRPQPKQVVLKGMNRESDLSLRRQITKTLIEEETQMLLNGYNPRLKKTLLVPEDDQADYVIDPKCSFGKACTEAVKHMKAEKNTVRDAKNYMAYIAAAAKKINLHDRPVAEISRRHIRMVLDACGTIRQQENKEWTANMFNTYRKNLMMVFKILNELEAVDGNPVKEISKQKTVKKVAQVLSLEERVRVNDHLKANYYPFWRYMQIFFHSGSRSKELMRLKGSDVKLNDQRFKVTVKKGNEYQEQWRPIKNIALPFWKEAMQDCEPEQFVFSKGLKPGSAMIDAIQISRRWRSHVKDDLKIDVDFYKLKHLNLDQTAAALDLQQASKMAGHTTTVITMDYAIGEKERQMERLKQVENSFT